MFDLRASLPRLREVPSFNIRTGLPVIYAKSFASKPIFNYKTQLESQYKGFHSGKEPSEG